MRIPILVVDDDRAMRWIVRTLLKPHLDLVIVGECENGLEAVRAAAATRPRVVVLDIEMPVLNGVDAIPRVLRKSPKTGILIFSSVSDGTIIDSAFSRGAAGYLGKARPALLPDAIRTVASGRLFYNAA
jgi:DNA-binding NarL/FixJ family response regulator